jgi:hypothetical protein
VPAGIVVSVKPRVAPIVVHGADLERGRVAPPWTTPDFSSFATFGTWHFPSGAFPAHSHLLRANRQKVVDPSRLPHNVAEGETESGYEGHQAGQETPT